MLINDPNGGQLLAKVLQIDINNITIRRYNAFQQHSNATDLIQPSDTNIYTQNQIDILHTLDNDRNNILYNITEVYLDNIITSIPYSHIEHLIITTVIVLTVDKLVGMDRIPYTCGMSNIHLIRYELTHDNIHLSHYNINILQTVNYITTFRFPSIIWHCFLHKLKEIIRDCMYSSSLKSKRYTPDIMIIPDFMNRLISIIQEHQQISVKSMSYKKREKFSSGYSLSHNTVFKEYQTFLLSYEVFDSIFGKEWRYGFPGHRFNNEISLQGRMINRVDTAPKTVGGAIPCIECRYNISPSSIRFRWLIECNVLCNDDWISLFLNERERGTPDYLF